MSKIIYPPYESGTNYFQLFCDYENKYSAHEYIGFKNSIEEIWAHREKPVDDMFFYKLHCANLAKFIKIRSLKDQINLFDKLNRKADDFLWAFITVGWNEQTVTPKKMLSASLKIQKFKYFSYCDFVMEKYRENGIHHHTHFLVKFTEKESPSKIIGWLFSAEIKEICLGKNFIDYLGPQSKKHHEDWDVYYNYVRGVKKEAKLTYVAQDAVWRGECGFQELYEL